MAYVIYHFTLLYEVSGLFLSLILKSFINPNYTVNLDLCILRTVSQLWVSWSCESDQAVSRQTVWNFDSSCQQTSDVIPTVSMLTVVTY